MTQTLSSAAADPATRREQSWVYYNGDFARYSEAKVGLLTHALNYGTGAFEGIRAYWNADQKQLYGLRVVEHYQRMSNNARVLQMALPHSPEKLADITDELLRRNDLREDCYVRPLVFKNAEEIGVRLHDVADSFSICVTPMGAYVPTNGLRCMVSSWRRVEDSMAPARTKCTGIYINSALAKSEAVQNGFDEAIFLTLEGHVCEGSAENIFLVREGRLLTPSASDNILEGITRQVVMELASSDLGIEVVERSIDRTELYVADEVFMCGTGAQIAPVTEIDRRPIGDGHIGELTRRIQDLYRQVVTGQHPAHRDWLRPVYPA